MIRLFDAGFTLDDVRTAELTLRVVGEDGYVLEGSSSMSQISRDPADLVAQTIGRHHQYPDGFMLFLGTLRPDAGPRHAGRRLHRKLGDVVTISNAKLGALTNTVRLSTECPEWTFGASHLMRNLAVAGSSDEQPRARRGPPRQRAVMIPRTHSCSRSGERG